MRPSRFTTYLPVAMSIILFLPVSSGQSPTESPVGLWKTIDDETGKEKSLVRITQLGDEFQGTIEKLFREPGEDPEPKCDKCEGARKDQPILGMNIIWGMTRKGSVWTGGTILDPKKGSTYRCTLKLEEGGTILKVRGYIGVSLIGRSQTWHRVE